MSQNELSELEVFRRAKNNERARRYRDRHKFDSAYIERIKAQYQNRKAYNQQYGKEYREKQKGNPEWKLRQREYNRRYKAGRATRLDKYHLNHQYGITIEQYNDLLAKQSGLCQICANAETAMRSGQVKNLSVDHCHKTGKIRGLLCAKCNFAIGLIEEEPKRIQEVLLYLKG